MLNSSVNFATELQSRDCEPMEPDRATEALLRALNPAFAFQSFQVAQHAIRAADFAGFADPSNRGRISIFPHVLSDTVENQLLTSGQRKRCRSHGTSPFDAARRTPRAGGRNYSQPLRTAGVMLSRERPAFDPPSWMAAAVVTAGPIVYRNLLESIMNHACGEN